MRIFDGMNSIALTGILLSISVGVLVAALVYLAVKSIRESSVEYRHSEQLDQIINGEDETFNLYSPETTEDVSWVVKRVRAWNRTWGKLLSPFSVKFTEENSRAGTTVFVVWLVIALGISIAMRNILAGLILPSIVIGLTFLALRMRTQIESEKMRDQITGFLFALKANVQANETPERALLKVVDTMPSPLYDELIPVKQQILSSVSFSDAMEYLKEHTRSPHLRFLAACMIQASSTGTSLEKQIDTIQHVVVEQQKISDEIGKAVRTSNITMGFATFVIPGTFIATYLIDPTVRDFWFVHPLSWIALIGAVGLYVVGMFFTRKFVNDVKKL